MTVTETARAGTVTRYWKTGIVIGSLSLDGLTDGAPASAVPGWLTSSVIPLEPRQHITIAIATGR